MWPLSGILFSNQHLFSVSINRTSLISSFSIYVHMTTVSSIPIHMISIKYMFLYLFMLLGLSLFSISFHMPNIISFSHIYSYGSHQVKKVSSNMRKMRRFNYIPRMPKVCSRHLLCIDSVQWFCYHIVKALIRLRGCVGRSGLSLFTYARRQNFYICS